MSYLGEGGRIPYLCKGKIIKEAEDVLNECWGEDYPVDVEAICDSLGIGILPVTGLSRTFQVDAFIAADFKSIYVDSREFEKNSHRYRFSVAHELGHYILHRKFCPQSVSGLKEWLEVFQKFANNYAEFQANFFAGNLLVPEDELMKVLNNAFEGCFAKNYWNASSSELGRILVVVRKHFQVSDQVIARRMHDVFPGVGDEVSEK